jgi:hypothetical protein
MQHAPRTAQMNSVLDLVNDAFVGCGDGPGSYAQQKEPGRDTRGSHFGWI